jgi:uracil-DNA glycosylase family 4
MLSDAASTPGHKCYTSVQSKRYLHRVNCSNDPQNGQANSRATRLTLLQDQIVACRKCPRLIAHCREIASVKRKAYAGWTYWGKPVPSFGDPDAKLLILGLAPAAHGANRTGRMFTGDRSGDWLYRVLHATGFASQPGNRSSDDGLELRGARIVASAHCAPPDNKPTPQELRNCRPWLEAELDLFPDLRVVVALGRIAFDIYLSILKDRGLIARRADFQFGHNRVHRPGPDLPVLISSYHPSQQNTSTGKLTEPMLTDVFLAARDLLA